jgi:hypothetical protein
MLVADNFNNIKNAALETLSFDDLTDVLSAATTPLVVVTKHSRYVDHSTTAYDPARHCFLRARHRFGARVYLKAIARKNKHVRLLDKNEYVDAAGVPMPKPTTVGGWSRGAANASN